MINVEIVEKTPINVEIKRDTVEVALTSTRILSNSLFERRAEIEGMFKHLVSTAYTEYTIVGGNITSVDVWDTDAKGTKLFSKTISYFDGNVVQTVLIDELSGEIKTTDLTYTVGGDIETKTVNYGSVPPLPTFDELYAESDVLALDVPVTNTRTGARKSVDANTTAEVAEDTADLFTYNGLTGIGVMDGATNKVDTDVKNWDTNAATVTEPTSYIYRVTENSSTTQHKVFDGGTVAANATLTFRVRRAVGARNVVVYINGIQLTERAIFDLSDGSVFGVVGSPTYSINLYDGWYYITYSGSSATSGVAIGLNDGNTGINADDYTGDGTSAVEIADVRFVEKTTKYAAFPDGSTDGATYGTDLVTCTPTFASEGTVVQALIPYGWSTGGHPVSGFSRMYQSSELQAWIANTALVDSASDTRISTLEDFVSGTILVFSGDWDGTTAGVRANNVSRLTAAETEGMSGTLYIGNASVADRPFHGAVFTCVFHRVLSDVEYEVMRSGFVSKLQGFEFR